MDQRPLWREKMSIRAIEDFHRSNLQNLDELGQFDYLVDLGVAFGRDSAVEKSENRIRGCKTAIWFKLDGRKIAASSDSLVVLGLLAILTEMYDGQQAEMIRETPIRFLDVVSEQVIYPEIKENGIRKIYGILSGSKEEQE